MSRLRIDFYFPGRVLFRFLAVLLCEGFQAVTVYLVQLHLGRHWRTLSCRNSLAFLNQGFWLCSQLKSSLRLNQRRSKTVTCSMAAGSWQETRPGRILQHLANCSLFKLDKFLYCAQKQAQSSQHLQRSHWEFFLRCVFSYRHFQLWTVRRSSTPYFPCTFPVFDASSHA